MSGPPAATAAVRVAVRRSLSDLAPRARVAAAVSGGADSLALAAALAAEHPEGLALVVDHQLQPESAQVAARAAAQCRDLGLAAQVLRAEVVGRTEGAAREARYAALTRAIPEFDLATVLLGHTLEDQAESVLLGLARGAGARSLAGMAPVRGPWRRPLLGVSRETVRQACAEAGLVPWEDPHNADLTFARVRVRHDVLPVLVQALGPGVVPALARSASQLREDADALDALTPETEECARLAALPAALRARALKRWAEEACGRAVAGTHVEALRALVEEWTGQGPVALPGGFRAMRRDGHLVCEGGSLAD